MSRQRDRPTTLAADETEADGSEFEHLVSHRVKKGEFDDTDVLSLLVREKSDGRLAIRLAETSSEDGSVTENIVTAFYDPE